MMKSIRKLLVLLFITVLLSSCGAIPTLPPMDSTITIRTPRFTDLHFLASVTSEVVIRVDDLPSATPEETPTGFTPSVTPFSSPTPENTTAPIPPTATATSTAPSTPTFTPQPTFIATPVPYQLQVMNPFYLSNFTHEELGCDWLGVAGQIFSSGGQVQVDILIKAGGELDGKPVEEDMTMPLAEPETDLAYGPGGYELTLASSPSDTESTAWVQLFSLEGDPLSEKIFLTTYNDCQKNLLLMNFIEQ